MHLTIPPSIQYLNGQIDAADLVSKKTTLASLKGVFHDECCRCELPQDKVVYCVDMLPAQVSEGELNFGVSHIEPGTVGNEFNMTRGHIHERIEQAEYYLGSQGEGLLVMQSQQGEVTIEKVFPGSIHHIPGFTAHRLVNTGEKKTVSNCYLAFCCRSQLRFFGRSGLSCESRSR